MYVCVHFDRATELCGDGVKQHSCESYVYWYILQLTTMLIGKTFLHRTLLRYYRALWPQKSRNKFSCAVALFFIFLYFVFIWCFRFYPRGALP